MKPVAWLDCWGDPHRTREAAMQDADSVPTPLYTHPEPIIEKQFPTKLTAQEFIDDYGEYIDEIPPLEPDIRDNNGYENYFSYDNVKNILEEYSRMITAIYKLKYDTERNSK